jgi:MoaA/NifB/PqqE/SkfB family radical SAM enzyme
MQQSPKRGTVTDRQTTSQIGPHAYIGGKVEYVIFDMVDRCNLLCPSCFHGIHGGSRKKMTLETCKVLLDHCRRHFGPKYIAPFNWGEPFICEELEAFIHLFAQYPEMSLLFSSNMNQELPDDVMELVLRHTKELYFSVSGMSQRVYKRYHRGGKIDRVIANIEKFAQMRDRIGSKTELVLKFGRNKHNGCEEPQVREFCETNRIDLGVNRYYITDAQDVLKILNNVEVQNTIYAPFYGCVEEARREIAESLTPYQCGLLTSDIVVDTDGYLMLCAVTKKTTKTHITEVTTTEQLAAVRLRDHFCNTCFKTGVVGYFRAPRAQQPAEAA